MIDESGMLAASGASAGARQDGAGDGSAYVDADVLEAVSDEQPAVGPGDDLAEIVAAVVAEPADAPAVVVSTTRAGSPWRRTVVAAGVVLAVLALLYVIDLAVSAGEVPRGVTVGGVQIGGMGIDDAESVLRQRLDARAQQRISVAAADVETDVVPAAAGLGIDWRRTMDLVAEQPHNPVTRLASLFMTRELGVESTVDDPALSAAIERLRVATDRPPVEGDVVFEDARPIAVYPDAGHTLDIEAARTVLSDEWFTNTRIQLPVTPGEVAVESAAVEQTLQDVAKPAVSADIAFTGRDGTTIATLRPGQIGAVVSFVPDGDGGLTLRYDRDAAVGLLAPQLAATEVAPKDAEISLVSGSPQVVPAVVGELVDLPKTLDALPQLLTAAAPRTAPVVYKPVQPELTTDDVEALGITEVVGEFSTGGFESASGVNIRQVASAVNGALVQPGETFSLNGYTGPRGRAQGYIESGVILRGRPQRAVGGGISQFATTLYNATYFAGLEDAAHTEHSYYISRYPQARDATVFEGAIDLQFRNNTDTGILIESYASSSTVTVRIWGTKTVDVESITGERYAQTEPETLVLPAGEGCVPSKGASGFTTSNTRVITDHVTGKEISRSTRTVTYDPIPIVRCE